LTSIAPFYIVGIVPMLLRRHRRRPMKMTLNNLLRDESGQDLIEYALVAALIALGAVAAMNGVATGISNAFSSVSSNLNAAI
jgi:pilus assembly protein Flp/PilA